MPTFDFTNRGDFTNGYFSSYTTQGSQHVISGAESQTIGDQISITGYGLNGNVKSLAFSNQFSEPGLGVADADARWNGQLDYYWDHNTHGTRVSERMEMDFGGTVDNFVLTVGMLGADEGRESGGARPPETGEWFAYASNGNLLGSGIINPDNSIAGNEGIYGEYRFNVDVGQPIAKIAVEARPFGYPDAHISAQNGHEQYNDKVDGENNSDIGITRISYDRVSYSSDPEPSNADPVARNDSYNIDEDGTLNGNVLGNDSDADNDPLTVKRINDVDHGTLNLNENGSFTYTPDEGFFGTDSFIYRANDGEGGTDNATVNITVNPVDDPTEPPANGDLVRAGLVAQFESDFNVAVNGGQVSAWQDGSGRGNHLSASGDPTLLANATPTGAAAIHFDGNGDILDRVGNLDGLANGNSDRTIFTVVDYISTEGVAAGVVYGDGDQNQAFGVTARRDGDLMVQGWGGKNDFDSNVDALPGGYMVQSVVLDNNVTQHYKNGTLIDSDRHNFNTDVERLILGGEIADLGQSELNISAVLIYDRALSNAERLQVEGYLQEKYITGDTTPDPEPKPEPDTIPDQAVKLDNNTVLYGYDADENLADIITKSGGYGIDGGRYDFQLDYDPNTGRSEKFVLDFINEDVDKVTVLLNMLASGEWRGNDETGAWKAFNSDNDEIGSGRFSPDEGDSIEGQNDAYGFEITANDRIDRLEITATPYGHGVGDDITNNNSDFQLLGVDSIL